MNNKVAGIVMAFVFILIFCILAVPVYAIMPGWGHETPSPEWYEVLTWLKSNIPPSEKVLAWWDYGYWIKYIADKNAVCTPSQESDIVPEVARYFLSSDNVPVPGHANYIVLDQRTTNSLMPAIISWAGYDASFDVTNSLIKRLYFCNAASPVPDYSLVFDNGIRIFKYNSPEN
jgi:hypothetical protein